MTATFNQPLQLRARLGGFARRVGEGLRNAAQAVGNRLGGGGGRTRAPGRGGTSNS